MLALPPLPALAATAVDRTTLSFRALKWWASLMPGEREVLHVFCGLTAFVLVVHALQFPLLVKFGAAPDRRQRRRILLALAFTELVPLAWAIANANAWAIAFDVTADDMGAAFGMATVVFLIIFISALVLLASKLPKGARDFVFICLLGGIANFVLAGLIPGSGVCVGMFMWTFGTLPVTAYVLVVLGKARPTPQPGARV